MPATPPPQQPTTIPRVPLETPMWEGTAEFDPKTLGKLSRTWILFWEKIFDGGKGGPYMRTLDLYDTTVGNDVAPRVTIHPGGLWRAAAAVLRTAIAADLVIRVKVTNAAGTTTLPLFTIPAATAVGTPVSFPSDARTFKDLDVVSWDVTSSDASSATNGVVSLTIWWQ